MKFHVNLSQWHDRTEEPIIVWVPLNAYIAQPVAVDDSHECDVYDEITRAWYAAEAYQTAEELEEAASWYDLTHEQIEDLYNQGNGAAEAAGLPGEWCAEGCNEDGSDALIYVDEETECNTHRESLTDAAPHLYPEDVAEIYREILAARAEDC